jgi:hypothetical protein
MTTLKDSGEAFCGPAHNEDMAHVASTPAWHRLVTVLQRLIDRLTRRGRRPPPAGVREPRRPRPTLPAAAVALAEPPTRRRIRLIRRRGDEREE